MIRITQEQRDLYHSEGYMILPDVIPPDMLTMLREECSYFLGYKDSQMDSRGHHSGWHQPSRQSLLHQ